MSDKTLYLLVTVSREWPHTHRNVLEKHLGTRVAEARDVGATRFVLVHGSYGWNPNLRAYNHEPPRSDAMARSIWVDQWGFEEEGHLPNWNLHKRAAGPIRNSAMVESMVAHRAEPGALVACEAFIVNASKGASGCAEMAERAELPTKRRMLEKAKAPRVSKPRGPYRAREVKTPPVPMPLVAPTPDPIPGPCGRCGYVRRLVTDNVLFSGDGVCVVARKHRGRAIWVYGCGLPDVVKDSRVSGPSTVCTQSVSVALRAARAS